jgi:hypothetical protein
MTTCLFKSALTVLSLFPKSSLLPVKPFRLSILLLHLAAIIGGTFAYSKTAIAQGYELPEAAHICAANSQKRAEREIQLIELINGFQRTAEEQVRELENIQNEMRSYSESLDGISRFLQNAYGWKRTVAGTFEKLSTALLNVPGVDITVDLNENGIGLERNPIKILESLLGVFDTLTPSNIVDWITGTSLQIARSKVAVTNTMMQLSDIHFEELRTLREQCRNEPDEQETPSSGGPLTIGGGIDKAGDTTGTALHLGTFGTSASQVTVNDYLGQGMGHPRLTEPYASHKDEVDFFKFTLNAPARVSIFLDSSEVLGDYEGYFPVSKVSMGSGYSDLILRHCYHPSCGHDINQTTIVFNDEDILPPGTYYFYLSLTQPVNALFNYSFNLNVTPAAEF